MSILTPENTAQAMKAIKILAWEIYQEEEIFGNTSETLDKRDHIGQIAICFDIPQATVDLLYERVKGWKTHPAEFGKAVANA